MKNPGGCSFGIFSMTVSYQVQAIQAGSGCWPVIEYLVLGWRS